MTTLTPTEAAILSQLREKPTQEIHINFDGDAEARWQCILTLIDAHLVRGAIYINMWRTNGMMTILHLKHEGRLALIAWENNQTEGNP